MQIFGGHMFIKDIFSFTEKRAANSTIYPHSHDRYEFIYFFKGKGTINYNNISYEFEDLSYCLMEPKISHSHFYKEKSDCLIIQFTLSEVSISSIVQKDALFKISNLCNKISEELNLKSYKYSYVINAIVNEIAVLIARTQFKKEQSYTYMLDNTIEYINEYYMTPIRINYLANKCGYSVDHYRILFKERTGLSPKQYLMNKRQNLAKELLILTKNSINDISRQCGFEFESQFSKYFKQVTGLSPLEYRKKHCVNK